MDNVSKPISVFLTNIPNGCDYDLRNNSSIPDNAGVTKIYLTNGGNGAYWLGFTKMLAAGDQGVRFEDKFRKI